ncbi:unnamed protein product [Pelagomonas calceolata]|uniref:Uncharacterized protein n=1 Tax=Pelagomonas calceolata TaxID=35677 RepID=A0A8J2T0N7_9STRA|nr:unnamed protein product [Pelagomonas calceolata]
MVPEDIGDAAQDAENDAEAARVKAWLDSGGDVNDVDKDRYTLIHCCAIGTRDRASEVTDAHVSLARTLIALGADVNTTDTFGDTPLHNALANAWRGRAWQDMLKLLLQAKANPNARNNEDETPLQHAIAIDQKYELSNPPLDLRASRSLIALRLLLRAGAWLDHKERDEAASDGWKTLITAEDIMTTLYGYNNEDEKVEEENDEAVVAIKALIAGVRKYGTYKRYMRAPHREFLAVRGLAQRGKLAVQLAITARAARENPALNFIARLGDNGVCWHILTYWRGTD